MKRDSRELGDQVAARLRLAFQSPSEVFRFFDILHQGLVKKEHFWFCVSSFNIDLSFGEILHLFDSLDSNHDGQIDEKEFTSGLYPLGFQSI